MTLDDRSTTLLPLPDVLSHGLVAVSSFGLLSFFCSTSLFFYLTWRLISWRIANRRSKNPPNQFLLLIYSLLLADIQQALAFLLNISALRNNAIIVGTPTCWAQGWFVSTGDLASSVFICAIALHTFFGVVKDYRLPTMAFYCCIAGAWTFVYAMAAIGPILHGKDFYVRADAWCWINHSFQAERLWLHYFWIFVAMFSTVLIYAIIIFYLRTPRCPLTSSSTNPPSSLISTPNNRHTPLMILYPLIYTICTAPLAAGRIVALAGHPVPLTYFCMAGTMIACNGWLDVLLYASTRADIVFSEFPPGENTGLETFAFMGKGHRLGTVTIIEANAEANGVTHSSIHGMRRGLSFGRGFGIRRKREESITEHLYGLDRIGIRGEVTVSSDVAQEHEIRRMINANRPMTTPTSSREGEGPESTRLDMGGWDRKSNETRSLRSSGGKSSEF